MKNWKFWRLLVLLCLIAGFAWTLYTRGIVGRFGGQAAALATDYKTEHDWVTWHVALDIEEMAAFADNRQPKAVSPLPQLTPWEPDTFVAVATAAFGDAARISNDALVIEVYPRLVAMDVASLVDSSMAVSQLLATNMRDAHAHESAALVLGAFALREAAEWFTDVRWSMNRMTAHLAVARALRQSDERSPDGALANVILLALSNQQARAHAELAKLGEGAPPEPLNAWNRALQLRLTQDWRALPDAAAASRLEKLEYFRARRATVRRQRALPLLESLGEPVAADFARIAQDSGVGVEDGGQLITGALDLELEEAAQAYRRLHGRPMPDAAALALNHRAPRLITEAPHVLPWGAWAEFYQRHIAMNVGRSDSYIRRSIGNPDRADESKRELETRIGELTMFPIATIGWTKGQGSEADLVYIRDMVDLTVKSPELIPVRAWRFAESGTHYEPVPKLMPRLADWFIAPTPATPFEAGIRRGEGLKSSHDMEALLAAAPHDMALLVEMSASGAGDQPAVKHARGLLEHHHDFDLRALDASLSYMDSETSRLPIRRKACAISSRDCIALAASLLFYGDDEAGAAATYEQAFADPDIDAIARSNDSYWLTTYYHRTGQIDKASALAEEVAATGAASGYFTRGRLYERLGRLDEAEQDFLNSAQRYQDLEGLVGFYYRRTQVDGNSAYANKWAKWSAEVFPNGLQPEPAALSGVPASGVFVNGDTEFSRRAGIRTGDILVGLEGWRVDNVQQYRVINFFKDDPTVRLTLSRGGQLVKVEARSPTRLFGTRIETHPMRGWIQQ